MSFTREEVVAEAWRRYGNPVCTDGIDDAMDEATLADAVTSILLETVMWDSPSGNCLDEKIWAKIKV